MAKLLVRRSSAMTAKRGSWRGHLMQEIDVGFGPCLKCSKCGIITEGVPPNQCSVTSRESKRRAIYLRMEAGHDS